MSATIMTTDRNQLTQSLKALSLSGMLDSLDNRLGQAADGHLGFQDFLQALCLDEINRRDAAALERRTRAARFESDARFENYDFTADPGIPAAQIRDLASGDWIRNGQHLIIAGPVGVGKTHIATALGQVAIQGGQSCRFITTSRMLADLAGGNADGSWGRRLRAYTKPDLLILDDFAMRELTGPQADDLYEIISSRARSSVIVTTNRAPEDWYPLFPNAVAAESLFDRLVNNAHHLTIQATSYRAKKRPPAQPVTSNTDTQVEELPGADPVELRDRRHWPVPPHVV
ncbi:MAG: IS21-like element helper ATPase IstB [Pseudonocardiaceae bacterium]